jgi:hypothetical protein
LDHHTQGSPAKALGRLNERLPTIRSIKTGISQFAAALMGADPADCIVIEDSPFGTQGPVAAGMTAIGYTGGGHTYLEHAARLTAAGADFVCADCMTSAGNCRGSGCRPNSAGTWG